MPKFILEQNTILISNDSAYLKDKYNLISVLAEEINVTGSHIQAYTDVFTQHLIMPRHLWRG